MTETNGPVSVSVNENDQSFVKLFCSEVNYGVSILLPISVNMMDYSLILDTGCAVTILSSNVYNKIPLASRPPLRKVPSSVKLEVANDGLLSVLGEVTLEFKIQKDTFKWDVFIAPIREDGLLGLDFLQAHNYVLGAESGLKLNKKKYKTVIQKVPLRAIKIRCKETVVLPAYSEVIVSGECAENVDMPKQGMVSPHFGNENKDYIIGHTLVDPNRSDIGIPVRILNPTNNDIIINSKTVLGIMQEVDAVKTSGCRNQSKRQPLKTEQTLPDHLQDLFKRSSKNLSPEEAWELEQLLTKHENVFARSPNDLGRTSVVKHQIHVDGNAKPIKQRPRRAPLAFANEEDKIIKEQLEAGIIRESSSPWSSPLVYVRKRDGGTRPCVDYRKLNQLTRADAYPLPNITDCLDSLGGATLFSNLDLQSGYWQIEVEEKDKPKTAFVCRKGLYEYNTMPFGLSGAPATFQRCMELVMRGLQWTVVIIYLDDLIIHARTFFEHLRKLDQVFTRLAEAGLKLKPSKCNLLQCEVLFLGHVISESGLKPDINKVKCIKEWAVPKNVHDVRSFCGFCSYYRRFIKNFSQRAAPINRLLEAGQPFDWNNQCQESFEDLKSALTGKEVMAFPQDHDLFIVDTDASDIGIGGVLSQMQWCDKTQKYEERPIVYASKSLTKPQRNYCTTRKELLAVVTFVQTFKQYLIGREFLIRSDNSSLKWLVSFKNPEGQIARWIEVLSHYNYKLEHRPGSRHKNADGLSRIPCVPETCQCYDGVTVLEQLPCGGCKSCQKKHEQWTVLEEIDDVKPLVSKRVKLRDISCFVHNIYMFVLSYGSLVGQKCSQLWNLFCICHVLGVGLDIFSGLRSSLWSFMRKVVMLFHKPKMYLDVVLKYNRLRAKGNLPPPSDSVELGQQTLTKDLGIGTHAGGLFPNGTSSGEQNSSSENSEEMYQFSNWVGSYSALELAKMQSEDPDIGLFLKWKLQFKDRPCRDKIAAESPAVRSLWLQWSQLFVQNGVLFRKWISVDSTLSYDQLVLPSVLRKEVLQSMHNGITAAHLGVHETVMKIKQNFYWYKMKESVRLWVGQCSFCEARKRPTKKPKAPLKEYSVGFPMDRVSVDVLGPFPVTKAGSRFILVVQDNFTKFVEAYAIANQTAETVAHKLVMEFFTKYGLPLDLHSDQGKNFQSELFRQVCCLLEINQTKTTSYRACSNGMVERFNQTLVNMITTYVNQEQDNWDVYLPIVTSAYRSSVHECTGFTPNLLFFGRETNLPIHFLFGLPAQARQKFSSYTDYVLNLNDKYCKIYELVRKNLKANAKRQKKDYDTRIVFHTYAIGDIVYVLDNSRVVGKSPKLKRQVWKGPFVVIRKISDILYELKGPTKSKLKIIHHDRMRPFKCNTIPQWVISLQQSLKTENSFVDSTVTKVIKRRKQNPNKLAKNNRKLNQNQDLCKEPEQILGKRERNPPERYQA
ncbi:MAG: DDE-type integrase/transposase/recombinase [Candidatus Thiodiazotropha taylori]|nr:DDE-type integrase/transposase/recombinase [Candidatus Thiodiazotropha taylori]MCW4335078.1 RNase H-like domain-containing protein [Candidatus Thiodiazotropha endolucinida]